MSQIIVENLTKQFQFQVKGNKKNFLFFKVRETIKKQIKAVNDISFKIEKGESIAFIGPNGAGKSTTIKMMTGILFPSSGKISVCNLNPTSERSKLSYKIGTVFGQRSQLSYHLPAIESFQFFSKIFNLNKKFFEKRLNFLINEFELNEIAEKPVRKLSLGERMRCEIVAALIHEPEVVFLDEPTIGLDILSKRKLRELLYRFNKENQTTIFLTSHDVGDIEILADRTIIINHGKIIFDDLTRKLKNSFINEKIISFRFKKPVFVIDIPGVTVDKLTSNGAKLRLNPQKNSIKNVLTQIVTNYEISDINIEDPPLEEIIEKIYSK